MTTVARLHDPGPHTIGREQSLVAAKQMMQKTHVRHLPVLHGGKLVGVLSDRELAAIETLPGSRQLTVEDAMVPDVYVTSEDAPLATVAGRDGAAANRVRHRAQGRARGRRVHGGRALRAARRRRSRRRRQRQREAGPAGARFDADRAAVVGDDAVNDRQAKAGPLGLVVKKASNTGSSSPKPGPSSSTSISTSAPAARAASRSRPPCSAIASIALRVRLSST